MTAKPCRHSPFLSREGNVSHASVNQLVHTGPLQEENIPLHSCNLQGLHRPEPQVFPPEYQKKLIRWLKNFPILFNQTTLLSYSQT